MNSTTNNRKPKARAGSLQRMVRRRWEYLDASMGDDINDRNELGEMGWELVAVSCHDADGFPPARVYHFKRESPNDKVSDPATPR